MNTPSTPLRVVGYVRVSTDKQDIGPDVQIAELEAYARVNGWDLDIRREDAASAASLKNRPVLAQALEDLKAGRADVLAVSKLDRLSRSVADFAGLLETAARQRWAVVSLDLNVDTTTITGAAMAQVTMTFAEMERKRIGERTKSAMARIKADTGKHMGRRSVLPAETVDRIRADRAAGMPMARIAATLNDEGVPTATGRTWYASTVRAVLTRETDKATASV
ncbi:DNA invertase Pin-like site-specific DNA recombinase [Micrococcus cohnii]|uniref:DNA invertase Pin-like site-specific DNA recombinase n=1 Tax=Micrococcus cohnii TaxID=993416 RepID=A0A7W7GPC0_9MICC|nr:recombinase family protein [Micrococcus cohnii]MBB4735838.1 DNA invertase Pin-like site-specific DNA recombinase [Micrococcus cohnii]